MCQNQARDQKTLNEAVIAGAQLGVTVHGIEKSVEYAPLGPATKTPKPAVPVAESRRQVVPWCAGPNPPKNGFQKQTMIVCRGPPVAGPSQQMRRKPLPHMIRYHKAMFVHSNFICKACVTNQTQ